MDTRFDGAPELMLEVGHALHADHPLPLLDIVSAIIAAADPPPRPIEDRPPHGTELDTLVRSFIDFPAAETSALLLAIDVLRPQPELVRARIRQAIARRQHEMPPWMDDLRATEVRRAVLLTHVLGDGDNVMLDMVLPDGSPMTALAFIDHNMGSALKDGFALPQPLEATLALIHDAADDPVDVVDLDPADARATVTAALDVADRMVDAPETSTWPLARPLLEWAVGMLPAGPPQRP